MNTITKGMLAAKLAEKTGMNAAQADEAINHTIDAIQDALVAGNKVALRGFGSFTPKIRAGRMGLNPRNPGALPIKIEAKTVVRFKSGTQLSAMLNPGAL